MSGWREGIGLLPPPLHFSLVKLKTQISFGRGGGANLPTPHARTPYPVPRTLSSQFRIIKLTHTPTHTHTHSHTHTHKHTYIQRSYYFRVRIADDSNLTLYPVIMEKNSFFNCISYTVTFASTVHFIFINVLILYAFQEIERKKKQLHKDCGNLAIRRARQGSNLFWFVKFWKV